MRRPDGFAWTQEHIDLLVMLREQGMPFGEIAEKLGATRNACIGKFSRVARQREKAGKSIIIPDFAKSSANGRVGVSNWTVSRVEFLAESRSQGKSFQWIGWKLKVSADACARRFARLRDERAASGNPIVIADPHKPTPRLPPPPPPPRYKPRPEPVSTVAIPKTNRVTLEELRHGQCRWVIGEPNGMETLFCGNPVHRRSYCAGHAQIGFYTPKKSHKRFKSQDVGEK